MQGSSTARNNICSQILRNRRKIQRNNNMRPCDVFINHRGIDTKRNVSGLLYNHLSRKLRLRPFLDSKNMMPGDKLCEKIDMAISQCKIGIAVFSPRYCDSYLCLRELALMMEARKKVIPVFCDVKPSELRVNDDGTCPPKDLDRFQMALEEAKYTVGLTFHTLKGDWSEFLTKASDAVTKNLIEVEQERLQRKQKFLSQIHVKSPTGKSTRKGILRLLYDRLQWFGFRPFLDSKNMKPGDKLFDNINMGTHKCKVGVAVFSSQHCDSYFCLRELGLMMESKKKVIPIFVKPSEVRVKDDEKEERSCCLQIEK